MSDEVKVNVSGPIPEDDIARVAAVDTIGPFVSVQHRNWWTHEVLPRLAEGGMVIDFST